MRLLLFGFWFAVCTGEISTFGTEPVRKAEPVPVSQFMIGISPYLDKSVKDEVYRGIVRLVVNDLPLNSTVSIFDAFALKTITHVVLPEAEAFKSPKTRANQFAPAIRDLKMFLAEEHARPAHAQMNFEGAIRLPQLLDFVAESGNASNVTLLIFGSPFYQDAREAGFSMVDGYFPSDGHLGAGRDQTVFGLGQTKATPHTVKSVDWIYFGEPWISDLHREKVARFWSLYLDCRGIRLDAFTSDQATGLDGFLHGARGVTPLERGWRAERGGKIEMLRVNRTVAKATDWLMSDRLPDPNPAPPSATVGPMKIGIRWKEDIDLDLYAKPGPEGETLFFQHVRSPEGFYFKDHRASPGREYEFIEFLQPVDVRQVEAYVNFYKGECPGGPRGEVRIEFDGRVYGGSFAVQAEQGNRGRTGTSQQSWWTRIPVRELLHLAPAG